MKEFIFTMYVSGRGETAEEAWQDFLDNFGTQDIGHEMPMTYWVNEETE